MDGAQILGEEMNTPALSPQLPRLFVNSASAADACLRATEWRLPIVPERQSDFSKVTQPVNDKYQPPDTLFCVLSSFCLVSWTPTPHLCKAPFPGPRPVPYFTLFGGVAELSVEERTVPLWPGVLEEDLSSIRKPGKRGPQVSKKGSL